VTASNEYADDEASYLYEVLLGGSGQSTLNELRNLQALVKHFNAGRSQRYT
jgi:hypothetical protein